MFNISTIPHEALRPTEQVPMKELFGFGEDKNLVERFKDQGPLVPPVDPFYKFPERETKVALLAIKRGESTYLVGHSGTGKTELVNQIAARTNRNVVRVNFDGHLLRSDLIGEYILQSGPNGMFSHWRWGKVPIAFRLPGTIVLLDEVDACPPDTTFVLQRALDTSKTLDVHETNQLIPLHPQNVIFGTANTKGQGDDSGLYSAGTHHQNFSFLARWKNTVILDYMTEEEEFKMLRLRFPNPADSQPIIKDESIKSVCQVLAKARAAFKNGTITQPLTTRDAIHWLEKIIIIRKPMFAAELTFLNRMPERDAASVAENIYVAFDIKADDSQRFKDRASTKRL